MYRLASQSKLSFDEDDHIMPTTVDEPRPLPREASVNDGTTTSQVPKIDPVQYELERRRLLQKLQRASASKLRLKSKSFRHHHEEMETESTTSVSSLRLWWERTRHKLHKGTSPRGGKTRFPHFARHDSQQQQPPSPPEPSTSGDVGPMRAFLDMEPQSTVTDYLWRGRLLVRRHSSDNDEDDGNKTVCSQNSFSSFLRINRKKQAPSHQKLSRAASLDEAFAGKIPRIHANPRKRLTRQGSSLMQRLFSWKQTKEPQSKVQPTHSWSVPLPDRLTPITTVDTLSDNENNDELVNIMGYESDDDEDTLQVYEDSSDDSAVTKAVPSYKGSDTDDDDDDDEDEEISEFCKIRSIDEPLEPPAIKLRTNFRDRWSPSPSPSIEAETAPRLPFRRPMPDEELDVLPPKYPVARKDRNEEINVLSATQLIARMDECISYPASDKAVDVLAPTNEEVHLTDQKTTARKNKKISYPAPVRTPPEPSWSYDSELDPSIENFKATFTDYSFPTMDDTQHPSIKGILKRPMYAKTTSPLFVKPKPRRSVVFDRITIREYERVVGDNPSCAKGPPISIGWAYNDVAEATVDIFERFRRPRAKNRREFQVSHEKRHEMLKSEWKVSMTDLEQAQEDALQIQDSRYRSIHEIMVRRAVARKPSADHSDTSQLPSLRQETAERATCYSPTPELMLRQRAYPSVFPSEAAPPA